LPENSDEFCHACRLTDRERKEVGKMAMIETIGSWGEPSETETRPVPVVHAIPVDRALAGVREKWLQANATARGFVVLFAFQVLLNVLVVAQERAAATLAFAPSFTANVLLAGVTYLTVRQLVAGRSAALGVGYALGGGVGGVVGLVVTRTLGI
jgi:hypothetical protein